MLFLLLLYVALAFCVAMMAMIRGRPGGVWFLRALFFTPFVCGPLVVALPREGGTFLTAEEIGEEPWDDMEDAPADATIRVVRHDAAPGQGKPCNIYINGNHAGAIEPEGIADFRVPHGKTLIEARNAWGRSRPLQVETAAGHRIDVELSNRYGRGLLSLWSRLFGSDDFLLLKQLPGLGSSEPTPAHNNGRRGRRSLLRRLAWR